MSSKLFLNTCEKFDWKKSTDKLLRDAESQREQSEKVLVAAETFCQQALVAQERSTKDVKQKIDSNIKEIDYWKEEIKAAIDELSEAHDAAEAMEKRISTARDHYLEIDGVTRRCFEKREHLESNKTVMDRPQANLHLEHEMLNNIILELESLKRKLSNDARKCRKMSKELEYAHDNKQTAKSLNEYVLSLSVSSPELKNKGNVTPRDCTMTEEKWREDMLDACHGALLLAKNTREVIQVSEFSLQSLKDKISQQYYVTDCYFQDNISVTSNCRSMLEEHLSTIQSQIRRAEDTLVTLKKFLSDRIPSIDLAETQLNVRTTRPASDRVFDMAQKRLLEEIHDMEASKHSLEKQIKTCETTLRALRRSEQKLKTDIQSKAHAQEVDSLFCMDSRSKVQFLDF